MKAELLKQPIKFYDPDYCWECDTEHGLELLDYFNHPLGYTSLIRTIASGGKYIKLNKTAVFRMRCNRCGHIYNIRWQDNMPYPVLDNGRAERLFMNDFKSKNTAR